MQTPNDLPQPETVVVTETAVPARDLPVVGAALTIGDLPAHRDWLLEAPRDLELQSFVDAEVLNGDWAPAVAEARRLLDGHQGRLGIHGPFWGFTVTSYDPDVRAVVRKRLSQALDVCAALGADQIVIHSPFSTWGYNHRGLYPADAARMLDAARDTLSAALARAADMGVTFVLENIEDKDPADRAQLADAPGTPTMPMSRPARRPSISSSAPPVPGFTTSTCRTQTATPTGTGRLAWERSSGRRSSPRCARSGRSRA